MMTLRYINKENDNARARVIRRPFNVAKNPHAHKERISKKKLKAGWGFRDIRVAGPVVEH